MIERQQCFGVINSLSDPYASIVENYVLRLEDRIADLEAELQKWQQPFDKERFEATQQQASHRDSLAADAVYITALEHALKHKEAENERLKGELDGAKNAMRRVITDGAPGSFLQWWLDESHV